MASRVQEMVPAGLPRGSPPKPSHTFIAKKMMAEHDALQSSLTPLQKRADHIETASTSCDSSGDTLSATMSSTSFAQEKANVGGKMMSPVMLPRGRISTGGASSGANSGDVSGDTPMTSPVTTAEDQAYYPKLEPAAAVAAGMAPKPSVDVKQPICQLPKLRGEHIPTCMKKHKEHKEKTYSEENHFGLCEHYASQLDRALEVGFGEIAWHCGFNLHHLAAKRNNAELLQFLLAQDAEPVHAVDEFGRKPIDYACPKKRDTVYFALEEAMRTVAAPDTPAERQYQDAKLGIVSVKKSSHGKDAMKASNIAESGAMENIAEGAVALKRPDDLMSAYEAEQQCPAEYQKILKSLCNGANWEGVQWPRGTSLLHWAARSGKDELCRFLVFEFRVDTRAEDVCGRSSIYYAKLKKHRKLAKKLINSFGFF